LPESQEHLQAKERIRNLARSKGYISENEVGFVCWSRYHGRSIIYYADILIVSNKEATATIVEIYGYKGHNSRYQTGRDTRRTEDICSMWGNHIDVRCFTIEELKTATDQEIEEDLNI